MLARTLDVYRRVAGSGRRADAPGGSGRDLDPDGALADGP
jgi:hypothetical protein